jgi:hypothetical protein
VVLVERGGDALELVLELLTVEAEDQLDCLVRPRAAAVEPLG